MPGFPPATPRYSLDRRGRQNTNDIYAQLQSPAQRAAIQQTLNEAVAQGVPEITFVPDPSGIGPDLPITSRSGQAPSYTAARRAADVAAYRATINPAELARGIQDNVNPSNIPNAYINPVAEGAYDTTPQFDWMGRQVAGYGAIRPRQTRADAMMYDLSYGRDHQSRVYQDAIDKAITNADYQAQVNRTLYETRRLPYNSATNGLENQYTRLDRDRYGSDPNYFYNLQVSNRVDVPDPYAFRQTMPTPEMQVAAQLQASQTRLSPSFYRGDRSTFQPSMFAPLFSY